MSLAEPLNFLITHVDFWDLELPQEVEFYELDAKAESILFCLTI